MRHLVTLANKHNGNFGYGCLPAAVVAAGKHASAALAIPPCTHADGTRQHGRSQSTSPSPPTACCTPRWRPRCACGCLASVHLPDGLQLCGFLSGQHRCLRPDPGTLMLSKCKPTGAVVSWHAHRQQHRCCICVSHADQPAQRRCHHQVRRCRVMPRAADSAVKLCRQ